MKPARTIALVAPVAGLVAAALVLHPGQYSFDSAYQLWQARSGAFNDTSPVAMTALWSLLLRIGGNPAALLWLNLAMFWAGLGLAAAAITRSAWWRVALLAVLGFAPLSLVEMAQLLSDAHLAAVMTLATGLAAWGVREQRRAPLLAACAALVWAGCVRHNAPVAILPFGGIAAQALRPARAGPAPNAVHRWGVACAAAITLCVVSAALSVAIDRALTREHATVWPSLALWDLAAISVASNTMLLPAFTRGGALTARELVDTGAFDPTSNTLLYQRSRSGVRDGLGEAYSPAQLRALRRVWLAAVAAHPYAYVAHRLRTLWLLIGPHRGPVQGVAYYEARTTFRDNPPLPEPVAPRAQSRVYAVAAALTPTWWFAGATYLAASLLAIAMAKWRRASGRIAIAVGASAIVYTLPLLLLAPSAELRYLTWPIVAGPLALLAALASRAVAGDATGAARGSIRDASRRRRSAAVRAIVGAALAGCALYGATAQASSVAIAAGASSDASIVGAAWGWTAPQPLREWPGSRLTWGIEADAMNIHARHGRPLGAASIAAIGATPSLRIEWPRENVTRYAEVGIGAHLLSHTHLRGGPRLGTAFQFGEWLGAGLRFGAQRAFEAGLRLEHLSNADIKLPNDGLTFIEARFGWHF